MVYFQKGDLYPQNDNKQFYWPMTSIGWFFVIMQTAFLCKK
jgi:hypothetical protein